MKTEAFHTTKDLRAEAERLGDTFASTYLAPALLFVALDKGPETAPDDTAALQMHTTHGRSGLAGFYHHKVAFLTKRPGNPLAHRITLGRAANNDIVIELPTISKFHAFFEQQGQGWQIAAQPSVNGTSISGVAVPQGTKRRVEDGNVIRLGEDLEALFLLPHSLREHVLETQRT